jgi:hypothetical protein
MSTERTESEQSRQGGDSRARQPAQGSSGLLKSGVDAREAARLSVEARRAKARQRQEEAEHAARTVHERAAVAIAKLSQRDLDSVIQAMLRTAQSGSVQAAKLLLDYLKLAHVEEDSGDALTPEQRAEAMAEIERWRDVPTITLPEPSDSRARAPGGGRARRPHRP